ncbi:MAG: prefoldin subunit alpha [Candidatus Pacearchaeota archaeon]
MENQMSPEQQKILAKLGKYEQQVKQLHQQLQAIESSIDEMKSLDFGLDEIQKIVKEDGEKEILAPMGRGIFIEAKLLSDKLTVDVGNKTFVKKSIPETKKIIKDQIEKLLDVKKDLDKRLEELNTEITQEISEAENDKE